MEELIKRLERVIATGAPDKDGMHPISAEAVLEVVKQLSELGTNLASLGTDCISRQQAIDAINEYMVGKRCDTDGTMMARLINELVIKQLPPIQPVIIYCKDCVKHNKGIGDIEEQPYGLIKHIMKDESCPLVSWRGKAQGHEFDYQFCVYGKRKEVTT